MWKKANKCAKIIKKNILDIVVPIIIKTIEWQIIAHEMHSHGVL